MKGHLLKCSKVGAITLDLDLHTPVACYLNGMIEKVDIKSPRLLYI